MQNTEKKPLIQVVDRAFDVLELLADSPAPMSATDLAAAMELSFQGTNNLLRTLYRRGYLSQDGKRRYRLGPKCFHLGVSADRWGRLRKASAAPLAELVSGSGMTAFVGVIENDKLYGVAIMKPGEAGISSPPQLWEDELHSTACGRILLAGMPSEERKKLFMRTTRRKITSKTEVSPVILDQLCAEITKQGYAEIKDESRQGISSMAIPLRDHNDNIYAAVALSATDDQWHKIPLTRKINYLKKTASEISG